MQGPILRRSAVVKKNHEENLSNVHDDDGDDDDEQGYIIYWMKHIVVNALIYSSKQGIWGNILFTNWFQIF